MTERELLGKLVMTQHLSVPERCALPNGVARASVLREVTENLLHERGRIPPDWSSDLDYDGGLLEICPEGGFHIIWKSEVAFLRFEITAISRFTTAAEAVDVWLRVMFEGDIDGVTIDWMS